MCGTPSVPQMEGPQDKSLRMVYRSQQPTTMGPQSYSHRN